MDSGSRGPSTSSTTGGGGDGTGTAAPTSAPNTYPPPGVTSSSVYALRWNNFQAHVSSGFKRALDEDEFTDVTLACEGRFLKAHRLLLSLCSPFFKRMFQVNTTRGDNTVVILNNVRFIDLENIIQFVYNGQVKISQADLPNFLETGDMLQIQGLSTYNKSSGLGKDGNSTAPLKQMLQPVVFPTKRTPLSSSSNSTSTGSTNPSTFTTTGTTANQQQPKTVYIAKAVSSRTSTTATNSAPVAAPTRFRASITSPTQNMEPSPLVAANLLSNFSTEPQIPNVDRSRSENSPIQNNPQSDGDGSNDGGQGTLGSLEDDQDDNGNGVTQHPLVDIDMNSDDEIVEMDNIKSEHLEYYSNDQLDFMENENEIVSIDEYGGSNQDFEVEDFQQDQDLYVEDYEGEDNEVEEISEIESGEGYVGVGSSQGYAQGQGSSSPSGVNRTIKRSRRAQKYQTCQYCGEVFYRSNISRHMATVHTQDLLAEGKRLFRCGICKIMYRNMSNLQAHTLTHHPE